MVQDSTSRSGELTYIFHENGELFVDGAEVKLTGRWLLSGETEIFVLIEGAQIKGKSIEFSQGLGSVETRGYHWRILAIDQEKMTTLEKYEGDAWDTGLAKERTYLATKL